MLALLSKLVVTLTLLVSAMHAPQSHKVFKGLTSIASPTDVATAEDAYFAANGKYFQVLPNNQIPPYESGTVTAAIGGTLPDPTYSVNTYEGPRGKGYFVTYSDITGFHSVGYGPQATDFTSVSPLVEQSVALPFNPASTTQTAL